ncbi:MAG: hypothetical protein L0H70_04255 [Xanthomonadales bacterium]|nr:hypothetical protein [Xanthomonadales bacterium]
MNRLACIGTTLTAALLLSCAGLARAQDNVVDPPQRVARMAYSAGDVEFAPAGTDTWGELSRNRPLINGDRLLTGRSGRAALELGDASARIDDNSAFSFLRLDQQVVQIELSQGTMNLRVRQIYGQQVYEIDTPTLAFVASQAGSYRIDVAPDGRGAMVTVFEGSGMVYGTDNAQRNVDAGNQYRFADSDLMRVSVRELPRGNSFDRFCAERDAQYADSTSRRYVADNVVGYEDLDRYGRWQSSAEYGHIWYPRDVGAAWAPYRDGHWAWIEPWGWTWVDNAPWGFAPFHYGRWAYVGQRWGWVPGPRAMRAVYAPALVAFIGSAGFSISLSSGGPVGWFPLGPRDVYLPPYRVSQRYFTRVNVTNIRVINRTVINHYYNDYHNHHRSWRDDYAYRHGRHAVTVVPRDVFTGAKPVAAGALRLRPDQLASTGVALRPRVTPRNASLGVMPRGRPAAASAAFDRKVVARHTPAPAVIPFAARAKAIAAQDGAPLTENQRSALRRSQDVTHTRVDVLNRAAPRGNPGVSRREPVRAPSTQRAAPTPRQAPAAPRVAPRGQPRGGPIAMPPQRHATPQPSRAEPATPVRRAPVQRAQPAVQPRGIPMPVQRPQVRPTPAAQPVRRATPVRQHEPVERLPQRAPVERAQPRAPIERAQSRARAPVHRAPPAQVERRAPVQRPAQARPQPREVIRAAAPPQRSAAPRGKPAKVDKSDDREHHRGEPRIQRH